MTFLFCAFAQYAFSMINFSIPPASTSLERQIFGCKDRADRARHGAWAGGMVKHGKLDNILARVMPVTDPPPSHPRAASAAAAAHIPYSAATTTAPWLRYHCSFCLPYSIPGVGYHMRGSILAQDIKFFMRFARATCRQPQHLLHALRETTPHRWLLWTPATAEHLIILQHTYTSVDDVSATYNIPTTPPRLPQNTW